MSIRCPSSTTCSASPHDDASRTPIDSADARHPAYSTEESVVRPARLPAMIEHAQYKWDIPFERRAQASRSGSAAKLSDSYPRFNLTGRRHGRGETAVLRRLGGAMPFRARLQPATALPSPQGSPSAIRGHRKEPVDTPVALHLSSQGAPCPARKATCGTSRPRCGSGKQAGKPALSARRKEFHPLGNPTATTILNTLRPILPTSEKKPPMR